MAPFEAVAKIYDPLYYSFSSDIGNYPCDVVLRADEDYAREVAAYECLTRAGQTGSFAPAYFGSRDLAPRNVFLIPPPKLTRDRTSELTQELPQEPPQRVVLIDYNASTVWELSKYGKQAVELARLPPNPMKRFWNTSFSDLGGWAPTLLSDVRRFQEWLRHEFGGEKKALYEPVLEELEFYKAPQEDLAAMPME
ncbi:hypothetical protein Daus18300_013761 [Diaporthe australafricana]|uniref:Uncharacterized protein n=1 Tax=Diaporthe australafricana TaxID=127596 RepID=A0ABR3VXT5_9PEZI